MVVPRSLCIYTASSTCLEVVVNLLVGLLDGRVTSGVQLGQRGARCMAAKNEGNWGIEGDLMSAYDESNTRRTCG